MTGSRKKLSFTRLSVKLPLLTFLWVTFVVCSLAYTMALNWQLEASAAARSAVADLRYSVFMAATYAGAPGREADYAAAVASAQGSLSRLRKGDKWQPLRLPDDPAVKEMFAGFEKKWSEQLCPALQSSRELGTSVPEEMVEDAGRDLSDMAGRISDYRERYLWQMRYIQGLLIFLAVCSLFAIIAFLYHWVIKPLQSIGAAVGRIYSGDLKTRITGYGSDEIGQIAEGFNRMTDRLEDSYDNLEQKVADKTASVEEKNSHLSQLYEMTSYFSQQHKTSDLTRGFAERIRHYTDADACLVMLLSERDDSSHLAAQLGIDEALARSVADCEDIENTPIGAAISKTYPVRVHLADVREKDSAARRFYEAGFRTSYGFPVRAASSAVGFFVIFFKKDTALPTQHVRLLETFASHLGVAVENNRLIERDRQFAVVSERQLLAQGLHDSIAQALSYLNLQVQFLSDAIKNNDIALRDESLEAIRTGVQQCYDDVRELLLNFRERVHTESFIEGVCTVIKRFEAQSHVSAKLRVSGSGPKLTDKQKLQVIFIIQEALSNVRKHAHAELVEVRIANRDDLVVTILDDGVGINDKLVAERRGRHVGLAIMDERASRIGARVTVRKASPIGGTRVELVLPKAARAEAL